MYHITRWDDNTVIASIEEINAAKRITRSQGHNGDHNGKWFCPIAYLADDDGFLVYNPRFRVGKDDDFRAIPLVVQTQRCIHAYAHGFCPFCDQYEHKRA